MILYGGLYSQMNQAGVINMRMSHVRDIQGQAVLWQQVQDINFAFKASHHSICCE